MTDNKQLIIQPKVSKNQLVKFVNNLEEEGIKTVFADPRILKKTKIQTIFPSQDANYVILDKEDSIIAEFPGMSRNVDDFIEFLESGLD